MGEEEVDIDEEEIRITSPYEQKDVLTSGNIEMDKKMGGGIPAGSLTIIEGPNDCGKSVVTQQILWGGLQQGFTITSYTTENTIKSLLKQMDSLALDISEYFLLGYLKIFPFSLKGTEGVAEIPYLKYIVDDMERKQDDIVIIDSLTVFVSRASENDILDFFSSCKNLCDHGKTILITVHDYAFGKEMLTRIRSICDAHLSIRLEEAGDKLIKIMEVAKIRGAQRSTGNIISFDVEPGFGLRIIPIGRAKA
ncbi:putative flagella-related protein H [ANME-1 cluster archaeon GoMg2]|nr:putative flagella-related protein H [ANME-1 cluster archaeon GoMg2]